MAMKNPWAGVRTQGVSLPPELEEEFAALGAKALGLDRAPADVGQPKFMAPKTPLVLAPPKTVAPLPAPATQTEINAAQKAAPPAKPLQTPPAKLPVVSSTPPKAPPAYSVSDGDNELEMTGVPRGSGIEKKLEGEDRFTTKDTSKVGDKSTDRRAIMMSSDQFADAANNMADLPALRRVRAGEKAQNNLLAMELHRKTGTDLSALASLIDSWTGSQFAKTYKAPETGAEQGDRILKHYEQLQEGRQKTMAEILKGISDQKGLGFNEYGVTHNQEGQQGSQTVNKIYLDAKDPNAMGGQIKSGQGGVDLKALERFQKQMKPFDDIMGQVEILENDIKGAVGVDDLDKWDGKKDIPGFGATRRLLRPMLSDQGKSVQQSADSLEKTYSNLTGGLALTATEAQLAKKALGQTLSSNDKVAMKGLLDFKKIIAAKMKQAQSGYHPSIPSMYKQNGSRLSDDFHIAKGGWLTQDSKVSPDARAAEKEALRKQLEELKKQ